MDENGAISVQEAETVLAQHNKQKVDAFLKALNDFLSTQEFRLHAVPIIDFEGKIKAEIKATPK